MNAAAHTVAGLAEQHGRCDLGVLASPTRGCVWSMLVVATREPSGLNATPSSAAVWPVKTMGSELALRQSQTRAVWSKLAVARREPSGLNATPWTSGGVAGQDDRWRFGVAPVPHLRGGVADAGRERDAVGAERHRVHDTALGQDDRGCFRVLPVPHLRGVVVGRGRDELPSGLNATS